ncbi:MAG: HAD-IA family hydrolase [Bryobacterales bacterium]|nr:HAD-IA family hydrolase [Bryobacterales bacterium]
MIPSFPVYLFDVDGTLLESAPDIVGATRQVLEAHGAPPLPFDYLASFIGKQLRELFVEVFPGVSDDFLEQLAQEYRETYWAREHASTKPYAGVLEGMAALGGRKATATTKSTRTTRTVLTKFGLIDHFEVVQGTDGFPAKPHPDVVFRALEGLGARPEECLFVGDSTSDMAAGRAAGVRLCAVDYGYGNHEEMRRYEPEYWIGDLRELSRRE